MNIKTGKTLQLLLGHDNQRFNLQSGISDDRTISLEKMKISDKNYKKEHERYLISNFISFVYGIINNDVLKNHQPIHLFVNILR